jgi:hypothetical protein
VRHTIIPVRDTTYVSVTHMQILKNIKREMRDWTWEFYQQHNSYQYAPRGNVMTHG